MRVAVITISDSAARGEREDKSGPAVIARCRELGYEIVSERLIPDESEEIRKLLSEICDSNRADLILTTGGTGLGPRDVTPEATQAIADKMIPGFAEEMRRKGMEHTSKAILSRGAAAVRGMTIILNFPGSPKGAVESLDAVAHLLHHAVQIVHGARHD
ncbi:MAG TPA: MogA/MoaB family molybdenum cofactor biosynthesis protein [Candidatus Acidoferrum sp.]|nr:MogA/MoaB family molybdenum cofactor biosynthesis protein [Candidatus Acidoferrum sp.]